MLESADDRIVMRFVYMGQEQWRFDDNHAPAITLHRMMPRVEPQKS